IASTLPLIGQHHLGRGTLLIPEPRVNSASLRSAAPAARSSTPPCSSGAVGPGTIYIRLRLGRDRGFEGESGSRGNSPSHIEKPGVSVGQRPPPTGIGVSSHR